MGLFFRDRVETSAVDPVNTKLEAASSLVVSDIVSPYAPANSLNTVVLADIFGDLDPDIFPVTRREAMSIPSIAKARALVCGQLSGLPLKAYKDGEPLKTQPTWLYRTDADQTPQHRIAWIVDDLMFYGSSLLWVERGEDGRISRAWHVWRERWSIDPKTNEIRINGDVGPKDNVVLIPALEPSGLLVTGARTIRLARDMENTRAARLRNPSPTIELHITSEEPLEEDEQAALVTAWTTARQASTGAVAVTPYNVEVVEHGATPTELFIDAQNGVAINVGQLLNIQGTLLDASVAAGASLNYQNMVQSRSWWLDTGLAYWARAIEARLSADDVTPRGTYIAFDISSLATIPQPTEPTALED